MVNPEESFKGFEVDYDYWSHGCKVEVRQIDPEEDYLEAEFVWDGTVHMRFPDYYCFHAPMYLKRHFALIELLYKRAHELMYAGHEYGWDDE